MNLARTVSIRNRRRKFELFLDFFRPGKDTKILDVGVTEIEYSPGDNFIEKLYAYPERITAVGLEADREFRKRYPQIPYVQADGRTLPFGDTSFDIVFSNAVIEHVGPYPEQLRFLKELARVAPAGFVTTPNRWFPIETHTKLPFVHYFPKPFADGCYRLFGRPWAAGDFMFLLSRRDLERLAADANLPDVRIIANRVLGIPLTYSLLWRRTP